MVDGYTSSSIFYNYFKENPLYKDYNIHIEYRIPKGKEHGLKTVISELIDRKRYDLIVCPDSSSNDYEEHKILHDMRYDIVVLDHHICSRYSKNAIVINNQLSDNYSNKSLSGVGVTYKFLEYFEACWKIDEGIEDNDFFGKKYLDLVALGINDIVLIYLFY